MTLHIVRESDPISIEQICVLVYGQPGIGKTSISQTAEAPLTLDFDRGIHRSGYRRDAVRVGAWSEVAAISNDEIGAYQTIVVDTAGRALDMLTARIIQDDAKMATAAGGLTLQGYGALKAKFAQWIKLLRELGKDVILLAHDAEEQKGDDVIVRPDIQGGSKLELYKVADAIGYLYRGQRSPILDFNATDKHIGKNSAHFDPLEVPHLSSDREFMARIISETKAAINSDSENQRAAVSEVDEFKAEVAEITDPDELSELIPRANEHSQKAAMRKIIWNRAQTLGFEYNKKKKQFQFAQEEAPAEPEGQGEAREPGSDDEG